ncbi:uncharacterized protein LOC142774374 [Rhipicephalus microplus]|uniref:uncharacterized protein LOC142774374 n=1 Tax=Rhipicephalus microplus TaxID=6941 RepID=UPI003F6D07B0
MATLLTAFVYLVLIAATQGATSIGSCGGGGHYCWDHHRCCHVLQSGAHLPTSLHHTTSCCAQGSHRQCPRIRGCYSNLGGVGSHSGIYNSPGTYIQSGTYNSPGVHAQSGIYNQRGSYNQPSVYSQSSYRSQQTYNNPSLHDRDREHQTVTHRRTVYYSRAAALPRPPIAAFALSFIFIWMFRTGKFTV